MRRRKTRSSSPADTAIGSEPSKPSKRDKPSNRSKPESKKPCPPGFYRAANGRCYMDLSNVKK